MSTGRPPPPPPGGRFGNGPPPQPTSFPGKRPSVRRNSEKQSADSAAASPISFPGKRPSVRRNSEKQSADSAAALLHMNPMSLRDIEMGTIRRPSQRRRSSHNPDPFGQEKIPPKIVSSPSKRGSLTLNQSVDKGVELAGKFVGAAKHIGLKKKERALGPDPFQMFPLPEIKWIKNSRSNWVLNLILAAFLAVMVAGLILLIWFYLGTGRYVAGVRLVHNSVPLVIRTEGCDVQFRHVRPIASDAMYKNTTSTTGERVPDYGTECLSRRKEVGNRDYQCDEWWDGPEKDPPNPGIIAGLIRRIFRYGIGNDCEYQMTRVFDKNDTIFGLNHYCLDYSFEWPLRSRLHQTFHIPLSDKRNDGSNVKVTTDYVNEYDIRFTKTGQYVTPGKEALWWTGPDPLPNSTVEITGFEAPGSVSPCIITVWVNNPLSAVTIVGTKSNPPISITKYEKATDLNGVENGTAIRPRWELEIDRFQVNGSTTKIELSNLKVSDIDVKIETGNVDIKGLHLKQKMVASTEYEDTNSTSRIETGIDLGARDGPGILIPTNQSQCITGEKECGGTIHVAMLSSTRVVYSQNEGIVCATARSVEVEANDCAAPNRTLSNLTNFSSTADQPLSGTCKGRALLCNAADFMCTSSMGASVRLLAVRALKGGVYVSAVDYNVSRTNMYNVRRTTSGKRCKFPFFDRIHERIHWDCTTEGQGERAWCEIDPRDLVKSSNGSCAFDAYNEVQNCTSNSSSVFNKEENWGFCEPYGKFQGFAYENIRVRFDAEGTANLNAIKTFENSVMNSPVMVRMNMNSKTSALGQSLWVYTTRTPYILIRNDRLSMFSANLISARSAPVKNIRVSPGYCPVESLPDATLSSAQMGVVHDALAEAANGASTSILSWLGEYATDIALRASGKQPKVDASPATWMPNGLTLYTRLGDGTYVLEKTGSLMGSSSADAAMFFTFLLIALYLLLCFCLVVPSLRRLFIREYNKYIRERRKLSLTEAQVRLEKRVKRREKELGDDGGGDDVDESKCFWAFDKNVHTSVSGWKKWIGIPPADLKKLTAELNDRHGNPIEFFEDAVTDLEAQIQYLSGEMLSKVEAYRARQTEILSTKREKGEEKGEETGEETGDCGGQCIILLDRIANAFCRCCCSRGNMQKTNSSFSRLEELHSQFSRIAAIRNKYRTTIAAHTDFFYNAPKLWKDKPEYSSMFSSMFSKTKAQKQKAQVRNDNHSRTILQIFPSIDPERKDPKGENQFLQLWVDIEEQFGYLIAKDRQGYVKDYKSAKIVLDLVKEYCTIEDKTMLKISKCFEICDKVWLLRERETSGYVEPLNIWEVADVGYHLFIAPLFKNSVRNFLEDEVLDERKVKNEWYMKQNILVQYFIAFFYIIEKPGGSNRKFLDYHYIPLVADNAANDEGLIDDGDDESDDESDDEVGSNEEPGDEGDDGKEGKAQPTEGKKSKESFLQIHSLPPFPLKTWNLGNQKRLQQHVAEIKKAGSIKLTALVDRYNTYCDAKGLVKIETDELITTLRDDYEFTYDAKTKTFLNVKFEPPGGRDSQGSDPWPQLKFAGLCMALLGFTLNLPFIVLFYVAVRYRGWGINVLLLIFREIMIIIPCVLMTVVMFQTTDPFKQFSEPGTIFGFKEFVETPYLFFDMGTNLFPTVQVCMFIIYLFFAIANIDLCLYYLHGDIPASDQGDEAGFFKKGQQVILKNGKTKKGCLGLFFIFTQFLCRKERGKTQDEKRNKMQKGMIYKIKGVNITRDGKVKNYVLDRSKLADFIPCSCSNGTSSTEGLNLKYIHKKLQGVHPPHFITWVHWIVHIAFLFLLNLIVSVVFAYAGMVCSWWVLGAIIQPERTLAFASTVLVMVGAVKALFTDFDKQRDQLKKKLEKAVSDFVETLISQTAQVAEAQKAKLASNLPKLPSALAGINMSAGEIFKALQTEQGQLELCMKAIDNAIATKFDPQMIKDQRVGYLKDFTACIARSKREDQLLAFRKLGVTIIVDNACGAGLDKQKLSAVGLLAEACFASDSINARDTLDKFEKVALSLVNPSRNPQMASLLRGATWFMKICADDLKLFTATKDKLIGFFQTMMTSLSESNARTSPTPKQKRQSRKSFVGKSGLNLPPPPSFSMEDILTGCLLFVSLSSIKNTLLQEAEQFLRPGDKRHKPLSGTRRSSSVMRSVNTLFSIDLLYSCDEHFTKLMKVLVASRGKQTTQVLICQDKIINTIFDQLMDIIGLTNEDRMTMKEKYRPVISKLLRVAGMLWNRIFNVQDTGTNPAKDVAKTPAKSASVANRLSNMRDEATELIKNLLKFSQNTKEEETSKLIEALLKQIKNDEKEQDEKDQSNEDDRQQTTKRLVNYFAHGLLIFENQIKDPKQAATVRNMMFRDESKAFLDNAKRKLINEESVNWFGSERERGLLQIIQAEYKERAIGFIQQLLKTYCPELARKVSAMTAASSPVGDTSSEPPIIIRAIAFAKKAAKLPAGKEKLPHKLTVMVSDLVDLCFCEDPPMKAKAMQIVDVGIKVMGLVEKTRASKTMKSGAVSKKEKYKTMFDQVDISGDGEVDFGEFVLLCNENLKLNLSTQRCKALFAKCDSNGSGTLNIKEFEKCMKLLENEITKASLAKIGLTEATMYPAMAGIVIWLTCILIFVLMGFSAFTEGTAFGAGVGALMPMLAGKSSGLKDMVSKVNVNELVEKTLKEDFQKDS